MLAIHPDKSRKNRWYFGGLGSSIALIATHPFDLIKVHIQVKEEKQARAKDIIRLITKNKGIGGLYSGLTASLFRQMTYSTTRFGTYDIGKNYFGAETFASKLGISVISGILGGLVGTPAELINVRMQNDSSLPYEKRRNYKHVFDGFYRVTKTEGFFALYSGVTMAITRCIIMTIGQIAFYDEIKSQLLKSGYFGDNMKLYGTASCLCGVINTYLTQPVDVIKTRFMNSPPGKYRGNWHVFIETAKEGPMAFFKGSFYALIRPQTVLTILIMEQLRLYFGA